MTTDMVARKIDEKLRIQLTDTRSIFTEEYYQLKGNVMKEGLVTIKPREYANIVTGLGASEIEVNDVNFTTSMILTAKHQFIWHAARFDQLTEADFQLLEVLNPGPDYILVSTGVETRQLPDPVRSFLSAFSVKVDAVKNFYAASVFNSCIEREVDVVAFFHLGR